MKLPIIETERLFIRPLAERDRGRYLEFITNETAPHYPVLAGMQKALRGTHDLFDTIVASYGTEDPVIALAIDLKGHGFVGGCGCAPLPQPGIHECYYGLLPAYWGRGYATEAIRALVGYCFTEPSIHEIRAYMAPDNVRSAGVAERAGMTHWGVHRHPVYGTVGRVYVIRRE